MYTAFSDDARAALRSVTGHTIATRVDVLHDGWPVYQLAAIDGGVTFEAGSAIRASIDCKLVDPTGELTEGDATALLSAYNAEIAPHRGVTYKVRSYGRLLTPNAGFGLQPFGTSGFGGVDESTIFTVRDETELAPLGVFGIAHKTIADGPDGLTITIDGQDRAMGYQVPMKSSLSIPGGTSIEKAIVTLLARVNPQLTLIAMSTGHTTDGPLWFDPDIDVWGEAQKLAESVGASLYHDRVGQCVLMPAGPNRYPVAAFVEGDGLLLSLDRTEDSDTVRNVVVARATDGSVVAVVYDNDPTSPTFAGGRYGYRAFLLENQFFASVTQAQKAGIAALIRELGRTETVQFEAVPDPCLDVDDVVIVDRPRAGLVRRSLVVDRLDVPLAVGGSMKVGCRKSILTQDGQVLPEEAA